MPESARSGGDAGALLCSLFVQRIVLLGLLGAASVLTYADRTNMGIVIVSMGDEYGWSPKTRGTVLGAFFIGYICTQIVGGWLADVLFGGAPVLFVGMLLWSVMLLATPAASERMGLPGTIAARILLGLAEGVCFPSIHSMIAGAIPATWLSGTMAYIGAMCYVGGVAALLLSAPLAANHGWQAVFYLFGALGLLWCVVWLVWVMAARRGAAKEPEEGPADNDGKDLAVATKKNGRRPAKMLFQRPKGAQELASTDDTPSTRHIREAKKDSVPWRALLTSSAVWALFTCNYCNCWGFWLILTWLPTYFRETFDADLEHLGNLSVLPYAMQGSLGLVVGFVGDLLLRRHLIRKRLLRCISQSVAMTGAAVLLLVLLVAQHSVLTAVIIVTLAMSLNAFSNVGINVNHFDLAPRHSGFLFGLTNSIGILPGVIGVPLTGWILEASGYKWDGVFILTAAHYVAGLIVWLIFGSTRTLS